MDLINTIICLNFEIIFSIINLKRCYGKEKLLL